MGIAEAWFAGGIEGELQQSNKIAREQLEIERARLNMTKRSLKEELIEELIDEGVLLPSYSKEEWERAKKGVDEIISDWFERHPEIKRGSGQFEEKYPEIDIATDVIAVLCEKGRMSPWQYVALYRGLLSF